METRNRTSATATAPTTPAVASDHLHRWRIEEPNGPTSVGICKVCGVEKYFKNWLSDMDFITNEEHRMAA
jgi:hypothetical protein